MDSSNTNNLGGTVNPEGALAMSEAGDEIKNKANANSNPDHDPNFHPNKRSFKQEFNRYKTFYFMLVPAILFFLIYIGVSRAVKNSLKYFSPTQPLPYMPELKENSLKASKFPVIGQ